MRALVIVAALGIAGCHPIRVECVNIASGERLIANGDRPLIDPQSSFDGVDRRGWVRSISRADRKWWKCRAIAQNPTEQSQ